MRVASGIILVGTLLLLASCGADKAPQARPSRPEGQRTASSKVTRTCPFLTPEDVARVFPGVVDPTKGMVHRSGWLIYCTWGNVYGAGASVDVRGYSASEWARAIPGALMDLQAGGQMTAAQLASLRTAAAQVSAGEVIPPDAACSLFSTILEAEGQPSGSIESVRTTSRPVDISAETCARGRYTSVTVSDAFDDKITLSKKLVQGVRIALVTARDRNRG